MRRFLEAERSAQGMVCKAREIQKEFERREAQMLGETLTAFERHAELRGFGAAFHTLLLEAGAPVGRRRGAPGGGAAGGEDEAARPLAGRARWRRGLQPRHRRCAARDRACGAVERRALLPLGQGPFDIVAKAEEGFCVGSSDVWESDDILDRPRTRRIGCCLCRRQGASLKDVERHAAARNCAMAERTGAQAKKKTFIFSFRAPTAKCGPYVSKEKKSWSATVKSVLLWSFFVFCRMQFFFAKTSDQPFQSVLHVIAPK